MDRTTAVLIKTIKLLVKDHEEIARELKEEAEHLQEGVGLCSYAMPVLAKFNARMEGIRRLEALIEELKA